MHAGQLSLWTWRSLFVVGAVEEIGGVSLRCADLVAGAVL